MTSLEYICELDKTSEIKALKELHEYPKDRLEAVAVLRTWVEEQPHLKAPTAPSEYICELDEASEIKALEELHEDPKDRLEAVLRAWVEQQPHLKAPTDTWFLIRFLRARKFSQLEARKLLENYLQSHTKLPTWFHSYDLEDKDFLRFIDGGSALIAPRRSRDGCQILFLRPGLINVKETTRDLVMRYVMMITEVALNNENNQVNGFVAIVDCTGYTMKHQQFFSFEQRRNVFQIFQKRLPLRMRALHVYNMGQFGEFLLGLLKLFLTDKMKGRLHIHSRGLESLYKVIDKEVLPEEYLPDDYSGPPSGSYTDIIADNKKLFLQGNIQERISIVSRPEYLIDETKRTDNEISASFRKIIVD